MNVHMDKWFKNEGTSNANQSISRWALHVCRWGSESLNRCYSLCQHMMHFFHQYLLYVTFEVLDPLWHTMSSQCRTATTLDEVLPCYPMLLCTSCSCSLADLPVSS